MSGWHEARRPRASSAIAAAFLSMLLCAVLLSSPTPARGEDFSIRSFRTGIEVRKDASLRVTETIEAEFERPRHGLYRDIPIRYIDELGRETVIPVTVDSVTDPSGTRWKYKVERRGGVLRIRIGDPDRYVEGRQVVAIAYTVENAVLFFPDHDELYWNATGNDWLAGIGSASASVTLADAGRSLALRSRCFTGARGSREEACRISPRADGADYRAEREFRAGEGLTIVLGWDKGIVRPPSAWRRLLYVLDPSENWALPAPVLSLCGMLVLWYRKGKDPGRGDPLVVEYTPPEEGGNVLLPAEVGALIDERLDPSDITATVVDLAVKRYLTIEERKTPGILFDKTDYLLRREKEPDAALPLFERLLMERLFRDRGPEVRVSDLKLAFYRNLDDLKKAAFEGLERTRYFAANPLSVKSAYVRAGVSILVLGGLLAVIGEKISGEVPVRTILAFGLSGLIVLFFAPRMPVKTSKGVKALGKIKGFEEFLLRAEKDRLERMNDPTLFERYLPYAIALGVSDRWANAFEGIYQEVPRWYASPDGTPAFRPSNFHRSLDSALSTLSGAMHAAPRGSGSGFSGGGSSGGGGGGGGGGSW
jgi:uncharacterized membrane protein YgcG